MLFSILNFNGGIVIWFGKELNIFNECYISCSTLCSWYRSLFAVLYVFREAEENLSEVEWSIIFLNEKTAVPPDSISIVCDCSNDVIFPSLFVPTINNWLMEFRIVYHNFNVFEYFSNNNKHKYKLLYQYIHYTYVYTE